MTIYRVQTGNVVVFNFATRQDYYEKPEEYSEDEEGEMVIDENPPEEIRSAASPPSNNNVNANNNNILSNGLQLKINNFGLGIGIASEQNIW